MMLNGKVAIVTGGGSGIGAGIAKYLSEKGAVIHIFDIDSSGAGRVVEAITRTGKQATAYQVDVTNKKSIEDAISGIIAKEGRVDILVNNAGTDIKGSITELDEKTWDLMMDLNLKGVFLCTQAVAKEMVKQESGRIVNISSMAGKTGEPFTSPYCATKFGVIGFTQSVALELGKHNITVNAVCPGACETELIKKSITGSAKLSGRSYEEELYEKFIKLTPMGRIARPIDVAKAVAFLASDEAEYITGSSINVSGGREMH
jgi:NAD(P)-dependent dehydrogenase (short-subunit alcohol dehydrogenase family)